MTKKKAPKRVRKPIRPLQPVAAADNPGGLSRVFAEEGGAARVAVPEPPKFGLGFIHLHQGTIVLGVSGPSFTTFRSKADAADWLRGLARSIELSYPTE